MQNRSIKIIFAIWDIPSILPPPLWGELLEPPEPFGDEAGTGIPIVLNPVP